MRDKAGRVKQTFQPVSYVLDDTKDQTCQLLTIPGLECNLGGETGLDDARMVTDPRRVQVHIPGYTRAGQKMPAQQ